MTINMEILRELGLTDNEVKVYLHLLSKGSQTGYEISKATGIYRVHVYDKLEQLLSRGLASYVLKGKVKVFRAAHPDKLLHLVEEKEQQLLLKKEHVNAMLPKLKELMTLPREDTFVEVFQGKEGIKYFLKDVIAIAKQVSIFGMDDSKYDSLLPHFMPQYFRDLRLKKISERVISVRREGKAFSFGKKVASTTSYRYLDSSDFNPTNTFVYANRVVLVTWGTPVTAIMIKNKSVADTYHEHFKQLWMIADSK